MFLKKVVIKGYKTFADKTIVEFVNGRNVIMGPNGSGKSNLTDAIKWALGSQSTKDLRCGKMEEVLYDGGNNGIPADEAYVILYFDNKDKYKDIDNEEIVIERRYSRKKGMEYFYNGEKTKLKDNLMLFSDSGIGKNNYSILSQGKVNEILISKPEDKTKIIEEAAGVSSIIDSLKHLEQTLADYDTNSEKIEIILKEIEKRLIPLKKQCKNAKKYNELKDALDSKEYCYYKKMKDDGIKELGILNEKIGKFTCEKEENEKKRIVLENAASSYDSNKVQMMSSLKLKESELNSLNECLKEKERILIKSEDEIHKYDEFISKCDTEIIKRNKSLGKIKDDKSKYEKDRVDNVRNIAELKREMESLCTDIKSLQEELKDFESKKSDINVNIKNTQYKIDSTLNKINGILNKNKVMDIDSFKSRIDSIKDRNLNLKNVISSMTENLEKIELIDKNINALMDNSIIRGIINKDNKLYKIKSLLEVDGGYCGIIKDLIEYDKQYEYAVNALFGNVLSNVLVDDTDCAVRCVNILKQNKIPSMNFMIGSKYINGKTRADVDGAFNAYDIICMDERYADVREELFMNSFICGDIDTAKTLWNRYQMKYKFATVKGDMFTGKILRGGYFEDEREVLLKYNNLISEKKNLLYLNSVYYENYGQMKDEIYKLKSKFEYEDNECRKLTDILIELNNSFKIAEDEKNKLAGFQKDEGDLSKSESVCHEKMKGLYTRRDVVQAEMQKSQMAVERIDGILKNFNPELSGDDAQQEKEMYIGKKDKCLADFDKVKKEIDILTVKKDIISGDLNDIKNCMDAQDIKNREDLKVITILTREGSSINEKLSSHLSKKDKWEKILKEIEDFNLDDMQNIGINEEDINSDVNILKEDIDKLNDSINKLGFINKEALKEYNETQNEYDEVCVKSKELITSKGEIKELISKLRAEATDKYSKCFDFIKNAYQEEFEKIFEGGNTNIFMDNPEKPLESGVYIEATPPGKKKKNISQLSGGENSLSAIAFISALMRYNPSPLIIFDEVDSALDEVNVAFIADYIKKKPEEQYIIVSHRTPMMKIADVLYGASISKSEGKSKLISIEVEV